MLGLDNPMTNPSADTHEPGIGLGLGLIALLAVLLVAALFSGALADNMGPGPGTTLLGL